jgi:Glucose dehydrogenase
VGYVRTVPSDRIGARCGHHRPVLPPAWTFRASHGSALHPERRLAPLHRRHEGTRYSPLDQINGSNFNQLEVAWRFKTDNLGPRPEYKLEGTPVAIKGILYTTGGTRRRSSRSTGRPAK